MNTRPGATMYTDDEKTYSNKQDVKHETIEHSTGDFVDEQATASGVEWF